jgi:Spy/CpxP family protein refolding chaperone
MPKNKLAAAALGVLVALPLSAGAGFAQHMGFDHGGPGGPGGPGGMHGDGSRFLMLLRSANLTAAQEAQVHLILNNNRAQMQSLRQQLANLHEKISSKLLGAGTVTSADLKPLVDKASRLEATLNENMTETAISIRNVLTPAQVTKLAEVHAKLENIHKQIRGLMGPGPDMPPPGDDN